MNFKFPTSPIDAIVEGEMDQTGHFYHQILQQLPDAFYTCDPSGRITFYNQHAADLWGQKPELGKSLWCGSWKIHLPDGRPLSLENSPMARVIKEEQPVKSQEILIERPDGSLVPVMTHPQPIFDQNRRLLGAFNVLKDITVIKKAVGNPTAIAINNIMAKEESRKDKEKLAAIYAEMKEKNKELQKINVDLDNFIYIASHDLKAPVSNLKGLLSTLSEILAEENSSKEEIKTILQMMNLSISRFSNTINDLTTITKIQKDADEEVVEKVNIHELIKDIKYLNGDLIANTGAQILVDSANCPEISFSRRNLKSILFNLITNAIKYRSPERIPEIRVSTEKNDQYIILKVSDNGLGLDKKKQKKLFSMFKRFHDHVEGTGIGLYLVKRIITNAGGMIEVVSEPEIGSTFKVFFRKN